ncbi:MAG: RNA 2',3'-cyclic phosphodiesterase [Bacteroidota bacterium]
MHRLFLALPLNPELNAYLDRHLPAYSVPQLRAVPLENRHVTALFLGDIAPDQLSFISSECADIAARHDAFSLRLAAIRPSPKPARPRILWAGMHPENAFLTLVQDLRDLLNPLLRQPDTRPPRPHITLGRYKKDFRPATPPSTISTPDAPILPISQLELWESHLKPSGAQYTCRESWPLR